MADERPLLRNGLTPRDVAVRVLNPADGNAVDLPPAPDDASGSFLEHLLGTPLAARPPHDAPMAHRNDLASGIAQDFAWVLSERERCIAVLWRYEDAWQELLVTSLSIEEAATVAALRQIAGEWEPPDYERGRLAAIDRFLERMDPREIGALRRGFDSPEEQRRRATLMAVRLAEELLSELRRRWSRSRGRHLEDADRIRALRLAFALQGAGEIAPGAAVRIAGAVLRWVSANSGTIGSRSGSARNLALNLVTSKEVPGLPIQKRALLVLLAKERERQATADAADLGPSVE